MNKKGKIRVVLGSMLALTLVITGAVIYQSGSKSTPKKKEFVKENEENIVDQAIRTEEREDEDAEEEDIEDVNTSKVEGVRKEKEQETEATSVQTQEEKNISQSPDINFTESSLMQWPVNGQVVLDYNMDHTIYFPTLNVYKMNPAVAISAETGTPVTAVANGKVLSITENEETGTTMTVDMGNGYRAIYGQLKDVPYQTEDYVSAGNVIGYVNEPTKYYSKEGANLYFALKKDGIALDPIQYLP